MSRSSSSKYVITYFQERPKAIAIVLGHLGVTHKELHRLAKLYLDRQCVVVAARSPPLDFLLAHHGRLRPVTQAIISETKSLLHQHQLSSVNDAEKSHKMSLPVVVHMWSNGGAFLWEEMIKDPALDQSVRPHLQYVAYDSCPCYLHMPWRLGPFWGDAFPFPGWPSWARHVFLVAASLSLSTWCFFTGSLSRSYVFWHHMQRPPCRHLVYFYSTNDKVTDASRIDHLIQEQETSGGFVVTRRRYSDSAHCKIHHDHAQEYVSTIDEALQKAIKKTTNS